jgi:hypothetical protein
MSAQVGDTHNLDRVKRAKSAPAAAYAGRGAGLYREVSWDPGVSLTGRDAGAWTAARGPSPRSETRDKA